MTIAIALASALLVVGLTVSDAARRGKRRDELLRSDPSQLLAPETNQPDHLTVGAVLSPIVGLVVIYHLAAPSAAGELKNRLSSLGMALAASVCAAYLLLQFHRNASEPRTEVRGQVGVSPLGARRLAGDGGFGLITLAACVLATLFVPRESNTFIHETYLSSLFALSFMTAFWTWLSAVWEQQLDEGRAWTTAGRLIPIARTASILAAVLGLAAGVAARLGPDSWTASPRAALIGHGLFLLACVGVRPYHRGSWGRPVFLIIAALSLLNLLRTAGILSPAGS